MSIARTSGLPGMDRLENEGRVSLQHEESSDDFMIMMEN